MAHFYAKQHVAEANLYLSLAYRKVEKPHYLEIEMVVASKVISADCSCVAGNIFVLSDQVLICWA